MMLLTSDLPKIFQFILENWRKRGALYKNGGCSGGGSSPLAHPQHHGPRSAFAGRPGEHHNYSEGVLMSSLGVLLVIVTWAEDNTYKLGSNCFLNAMLLLIASYKIDGVTHFKRT